MTEFIITEEENGRQLGDVLKIRGYSNRLVRRLKRTENGITSQGKLITTVTVVKTGQIVRLGDIQGEALEPNGGLNVDILFENENVIVFDKPPLMPVHPSINHQGDTLGNFFAYHCKGMTFRPINRLDRDTSGCVIAAKDQHSAHILQKNYKKKYFCITKELPFSGGRICAPIARKEQSIILRCVRDDGQYAATVWNTVLKKNGFCLNEILLETGRTHQIRVHFAHKGYPLTGDDMYGGDCTLISRQALHCGEIAFKDPYCGKIITVCSPLPDDMKNILGLR